MADFEIIPAILENSVEAVEKRLAMIKGKAERVSIDVIDGIYADNLTVGLEDLRGVDFYGLTVEVQLMTEYPVEYLGVCKSLGVERAFGHIEKMDDQAAFVETARELEIAPAFGVDLYTPLESIEGKLLEELDGVLLMSVKAGFSGQHFNKTVLEKIKKLREMGFEGDIEMDGGMNPETVKACYGAGANQFSVTSYLWKASNIDEALDKLRMVG